MKFWYFLVKALLFIPVKLFLPTKIVGNKEYIKHNQCIIVANHMSMLDIAIAIVNTHGFRVFFAKKELEHGHFVSWFARRLGTIFVGRGNSDIGAIRSVMKSIRDKHTLMIYPEGTRNTVNSDIMPIKPGASVFALKGKIPMITAILHDRPKILHMNYMYIGEPFTFDDYADVKVTQTVIDETNDIIMQHMLADKNYIDEYVAQRRNKRKRR